MPSRSARYLYDQCPPSGTEPTKWCTLHGSSSPWGYLPTAETKATSNNVMVKILGGTMVEMNMLGHLGETCMIVTLWTVLLWVIRRNLDKAKFTVCLMLSLKMNLPVLLVRQCKPWWCTTYCHGCTMPKNEIALLIPSHLYVIDLCHVVHNRIICICISRCHCIVVMARNPNVCVPFDLGGGKHGRKQPESFANQRKNGLVYDKPMSFDKNRNHHQQSWWTQSNCPSLVTVLKVH